MKTDSAITFELWMEKLRVLAEKDEQGWLIASEPDIHREAYEKGLAPEEELAKLADMAEWRGCGCGGG